MLKFKSLKDKYSFLELRKNKSNYVFLDLEFNSFTNDGSFHEITSIGAIKCDKYFKNISCFHSYVTPISYEKMKYNKLEQTFYTMSNKKIPKEGESFLKVINKFSNWLGNTDADIFVWGTSDAPVLMSNLEALNIEDKFSYIINKIKNIQPEISSHIKVLGSPINYSISLENIKKLFFLNKEVTHNALLDAIDLMKVFKKYNNKSDINQDILYELSYIYRNVDTQYQAENFKQNDKNKKNKRSYSDSNPRVLINNPNSQLIEKMVETLETCNFKFTNEYPRFSLENDTLVFSKSNQINNDVAFNTTKDNCSIFIEEGKTHIKLNNEEENKHETLTILTKHLPNGLYSKLNEEIFFSSNIYKNINIEDIDMEKATLINYFLRYGKMNFSNNINNITLINNQLFVKRKKDNNSNLSAKYNCNFYIKNQRKHYDLVLNYKCSYKNAMVQKDFVIPKNKESKAIIQELIEINRTDKKYTKPKLIEMNETAKNLITEIANQKCLKTKRKSQVFIDSDRIKFLKGKHIEYLNFENSTFLVTNEQRPTLILKNLNNSNVYEFRLLKNKQTINHIKQLFKHYNRYKPRITKIYNLNNLNSELLNKLKRINSFVLNNNYTYHLSNGFVTVSKVIKNEYQDEVYNLKDFNIQLTVNKDYNMSINFIHKDNLKKNFTTGISSKRFHVSELLVLLNCINKHKNNNNLKIEYFSKDLLNLLRDCKNRKLIVSDNEFLNLDIQSEYLKIKKKRTNNQISINIKNCSTEIVISKELMFLKIYNKNNSFYYSIQNTKNNRAHFEKLFKLAKKYKSNSWIKVFEINKNIRNSIWRVVENSKNESISSISFDNNYLRADEKKYFYQNTPLSIKKVASDKLLLQFGIKDSTLYDIAINDKNKIFIDDLINNTLFYEEQTS